MFARHAQEASSERMQDLWGRVLAGQLRVPSTFSLQTLRFVSELDEEIVHLFERWSPHVVDADFIPNPAKHGADFSELIKLEDFGLVVGSTGNLSKTFNSNNFAEILPGPVGETLAWAFRFKGYDMIITVKIPFNITFSNVLLTRIGREIYSITKTKGSLEAVKAFADHIPKLNVQQITCTSHELVAGELPTILWTKPPEGPPQQ